MSVTSNFYRINDFKVRPNAGDGLWVLFLLPLSLIAPILKYPMESSFVTPTYKLTSLLCIGLTITSVTILFQIQRNQRLKVMNVWTVLTFLMNVKLLFVSSRSFIMPIDITSFVLASLFCTFLYFKIYIFTLRNFKNCFTFGEAGFVSQGFIIVLFCTINNCIKSHANFSSNMSMSTLIVQVGLLGIGVLSFIVYLYKVKSTKLFYFLTICTVFSIYGILHFLLKKNPVKWILNSILHDSLMLKLMIYWMFCVVFAVATVANQIEHAKKASTSMRKVFHILAIVVYIPGLLYKCSFLYLASGVVLGIFLFLEILRILNIPPLGVHLQDGFVVFSDEKDVGVLALTPIYLLAGCSLPLWIHPSPCDATDSAMPSILPLLSGLLAIGVGDTAASVIGSNYGKHFWRGSKKTKEGTVACILAQIGLIQLLTYFGVLEQLTMGSYIKLYAAILVGSIVEAKTSQIDNLVLPLIMYIILI